MKILIVTITPNCSVDRLAEMVRSHNEHLDIEVFPFHAKRHSKEDLLDFERRAKDADLIDFEYWRGADVLIKEFPWLKDKKKILTHHNPYDLDKIDPALFDKVIVKNKTQRSELPGSIYIPHAVPFDWYKFNSDNYNVDGKAVLMVAYRIESKKGIREVAQACKDLGYKFILAGKVSKPDYMKEVVAIGGDFEFYENPTDDELREYYWNATLHVCNSVDNFESGTMPILEAMAVGIPVLTREVGLVPDIATDENMYVRTGQPEDLENLKAALKDIIEDREGRLKMREKAWHTVKNYNDYRMAKKYAQLFNDVLFPARPLVSVITATRDRKDQVLNIIDALKTQTYSNIEFVVCDDNSMDGTEEAVKSKRGDVNFPIKYINTEKVGYNLAMARNMGIVEADGKFLVFLDSRLTIQDDSIMKLVAGLCKGEYQIRSEKVWAFGEKGGNKKTFVENFSCVRRLLFIRGGMFLERINKYGGMSQEIRKRYGAQGFQFLYLEEAKAKEQIRAKGFASKRDDIVEMKNTLWKIGY